MNPTFGLSGRPRRSHHSDSLDALTRSRNKDPSTGDMVRQFAEPGVPPPTGVIRRRPKPTARRLQNHAARKNRYRSRPAWPQAAPAFNAVFPS
jgi:hypothetical protein